MKTTTTTTYEHDAAGHLIRQTVVSEELPSGELLRLDGLSEGDIAVLVDIRDRLIKKAAKR